MGNTSSREESNSRLFLSETLFFHALKGFLGRFVAHSLDFGIVRYRLSVEGVHRRVDEILRRIASTGRAFVHTCAE